MQLQWKGASVDAKELIEAFEAKGWTFTVSKRNHALGRAPAPSTMTVSIPHKLGPNRSKQNAQATLRRFIQERDVDRMGKTLHALAGGDGIDPVVDGILAASLEKKAPALAAAMMTDEKIVVSRKPWLARVGTNRNKATADLYESEAVVEVTYSDGSVMYECAFEGCEREAKSPRSIASHWRQHVHRGEAEPVSRNRPTVAVDVPVDPASIGSSYPGKHVEYRPSDRLVEALAQYLNDFGMGTPEQAAMWALTWMHDRPDLGDPEERVAEPLTDTQIVERIRRLVGGRDPEAEEALRNALATVDRLQEAYAESVSQVAVLEQALADSKARADALQSDLDTWLSLAPRPNAG